MLCLFLLQAKYWKRLSNKIFVFIAIVLFIKQDNVIEYFELHKQINHLIFFSLQNFRWKDDGIFLSLLSCYSFNISKCDFIRINVDSNKKTAEGDSSNEQRW